VGPSRSPGPAAAVELNVRQADTHGVAASDGRAGIVNIATRRGRTQIYIDGKEMAVVYPEQDVSVLLPPAPPCSCAHKDLVHWPTDNGHDRARSL
jgi:hypothetical protein